ncbi:MAG: adenylate/guanylate cyclase domain-containing protein, partial [Saprospiraceae bacterium]|nr:adenylate/guanylate cyclase domain-containing protein [Saprospiraceae bacterium]
MESKRQLAAIMFTDIVGYTQLMGRDEEGAIQLLRLNREIHQATIEEFGGKLLKEMGDGNLASFPTISGAVSAALKIQEGAGSIQGLNLRIGLHQGEILEERGDIFGDGVNIASRLQELAQPNQVLVSEAVYRNVRNRKGLHIAPLGKKHLKNVDDQIRVYAVTSAGKETGTVPGGSFKSKSNGSWLLWGGAAVLALAAAIMFSRTSTTANRDLTEKSIAILPFKTVGEEKEGEYFAQGIMDVLSVSLGKLENLQVRSGTSVARYTE